LASSAETIAVATVDGQQVSEAVSVFVDLHDHDIPDIRKLIAMRAGSDVALDHIVLESFHQVEVRGVSE
tara:strand:- start:111 stop:317 length:207 start_codon:yes stop_codon:yes gene_type:complete